MRMVPQLNATAAAEGAGQGGQEGKQPQQQQQMTALQVSGLGSYTEYGL